MFFCVTLFTKLQTDVGIKYANAIKNIPTENITEKKITNKLLSLDIISKYWISYLLSKSV